MSMTAIVTRSPLHPLSMNGGGGAQQQPPPNNGNKRKSTRLVFDANDNNDAPPAKKTKSAQNTTATAGAKSGATATRSGGNVKKRIPKAYDEDADGFAFSRTRSKKAKVQTIQPQSSDPPPETQSQAKTVAPTPVPAAAANETSTEAAPAKLLPKRKPRRTLPVSPDQDRVRKLVVPQRRSKRLSADNRHSSPMQIDAQNEHTQSQQQPAESIVRNEIITTPKKTSEPLRHADSPKIQPPAQEDQSLNVEKKRRLTKIPLPTSDTPIMRRNKEMRKTSAENSRRSSSGMRGRRASSLIDTGASHAVPHAEVETQELYKHIAQDLIEPKRMRQLLVWCGNRALPEKPGGQLKPDETAAIHAARVIQEDLLNDFGTKSELSSWFDREDVTPPTVLVKKPNPRNIQNAQKLQQLEAELARLQEEKRTWDELISSTSSDRQKPSPPQQQQPLTDPKASSIDSSLLDPSQTEILNSLLSNLTTTTMEGEDSQQQQQQQSLAESANDTALSAQTRIRNLSRSIEFQIDQFADSAHRMEQYRQTAERVADRILAAGAKKLEERDNILREKTSSSSSSSAAAAAVGAGKAAGVGSIDTIDTLRTLSRVLRDKKR